MVTYKELQKQLKDSINSKSKDELYNFTELLFDEFFKAYANNDLPKMQSVYSTIDDFIFSLESKYDNVNAVVNSVELQKHKEFHILKEHQHNLLHSKDRILIYQLLLHELESKVAYLKRILCYYFVNTNSFNDDGNKYVKDLDTLIAEIRDDIIDLSAVAEMYFKDSTAADVNLEIKTSKEIIHDVFNYGYMKYLKENGMVEIQMEMIEIYKLNYQCNEKFKALKLEIDELFSKNHGFKKISDSFINMLKTETDVGASADAILDYLPEYDIATASFIPIEFPVDDDN